MAAILRDWRRLTGGARVRDGERRTLAACSGGADSTALALALHAAGALAGLAHVVHDLRPEAEALADRDAVRALAAELGVAFLERRVRAAGEAGRAGRGLEAAARRGRYAALAAMAAEAGCPFAATAHQAEDQLETIVMRLARGAGPRGLAGIPARRRLGSLVVVRPCLGVRRGELEALCDRAGVAPRVDATNEDRGYARNAVRAVVMPELERLYPGTASRTSELSRRMRQVEAAIRWAARRLAAGGMPGRAGLAGAPRAVAHAVLRDAAIARGAGPDRLGWRTGDAIVRAVRDGVGGERRYAWGGAVVVVTATEVRVEPA